MPKKTEDKKGSQGQFLSLRIDPLYVSAFDTEIEKRGVNNRNDGIRQLIAAWCRNPEALPIGLSPKQLNQMD